jgi:hypothetical protein
LKARQISSKEELIFSLEPQVVSKTILNEEISIFLASKV